MPRKFRLRGEISTVRPLRAFEVHLRRSVPRRNGGRHSGSFPVPGSGATTGHARRAACGSSRCSSRGITRPISTIPRTFADAFHEGGILQGSVRARKFASNERSPEPSDPPRLDEDLVDLFRSEAEERTARDLRKIHRAPCTSSHRRRFCRHFRSSRNGGGCGAHTSS